MDNNAYHQVLKVVAEMNVWLSVSLCAGMRSEETPLIELAGTRNKLDSKMGDGPYFSVVILGRTKGNKVSGSKFNFPCVYFISGSG